MPEPGASSGNQGDFGGSNDMDNEGGGGKATGKSRGGYSGGGPKGAARDPSGAFAGGEGNGRDPIGPNDVWAGIAGGFGLGGIPGAIIGGGWGYANAHPSALGRRGGGTLGPDARGNPRGDDGRDARDFAESGSMSFTDWMNQGGFGAQQAPLGAPGNDFFNQSRFGGTGGVDMTGGGSPIMTNPTEGVTGLLDRASGMFGQRRGQQAPTGAPAAPAAPPTPYYTPGASQAGVSPEYNQMYGVGSPFMGPADVFGG